MKNNNKKHMANWEYRNIILKDIDTNIKYYAETIKQTKLLNINRNDLLKTIKNKSNRINNYEIIDYQKIHTKGLTNPNRNYNPYYLITLENTKTNKVVNFTSTKEAAEYLNVCIGCIYKLLHKSFEIVKGYKLIEAKRLYTNNNTNNTIKILN